MTLETIFHSAREIPAGPEREVFLKTACDGDPLLLQEVRALLHAAETDSELFAEPFLLLEGTTTCLSRTDASNIPRF